MRIAKLVEPDPSARYAGRGKVPNWYHVSCFAEKKSDLDAQNLSPTDIDGE